jgi:hypothetical protein
VAPKQILFYICPLQLSFSLIHFLLQDATNRGFTVHNLVLLRYAYLTYWCVAVDGACYVTALSGPSYKCRFCLQFTILCYTHVLISALSSSLPFLGNGCQRLTFPFHPILRCLPPCLSHSHSSYRAALRALHANSGWRLTHSLTDQLSTTPQFSQNICYSMTCARTTKKTHFQTVPLLIKDVFMNLPHGTKSMKTSVIDTAVKDVQKTVIFQHQLVALLLRAWLLWRLFINGRCSQNHYAVLARSRCLATCEYITLYSHF